MQIILRIGTTGIGGGVDEKLTFDNADAATRELIARAPELTVANIQEILSAPDTQFERNEMIVAPTGDAAATKSRFTHEKQTVLPQPAQSQP